ncbi:unnamed protein product [Sphagnum troendelagicum]|uniref:Uncharacterized protein n=1 Tax=Sphagnum troendelagicum TaxID=128251 RepID=A0ABP0U638_9BRYO
MDKQMGVWTVKLLLVAVLKALVCSLYIVPGVSGIQALAIENIKLSYTNLINWTGDPCVPAPHPWVTCSTSDTGPIITGVDLSDYNLVGPISPNFGDLLNLTSLLIQNNNFSGPIPPSLISHSGAWTFVYAPGNPMLGSRTSKPTNIGIIIGPIIGGILVLVIIIGVIVYFQVQNKRGKTTKTSGNLQMMKSSHQGK